MKTQIIFSLTKQIKKQPGIAGIADHRDQQTDTLSIIVVKPFQFGQIDQFAGIDGFRIRVD